MFTVKVGYHCAENSCKSADDYDDNSDDVANDNGNNSDVDNDNNSNGIQRKR